MQARKVDLRVMCHGKCDCGYVSGTHNCWAELQLTQPVISRLHLEKMMSRQLPSEVSSDSAEMGIKK